MTHINTHCSNPHRCIYVNMDQAWEDDERILSHINTKDFQRLTYEVRLEYQSVQPLLAMHEQPSL